MKIFDDNVSKDLLSAIKGVMESNSELDEARRMSFVTSALSSKYPKDVQVHKDRPFRKDDYVRTPGPGGKVGEGKVGRVIDADKEIATVKIHGEDKTEKHPHSSLKPYRSETKKMSEETEHLTELNKILGRYIGKAKEQLKPSKPGRPSKEFLATKAKRESGISLASKKLHTKVNVMMKQNQENYEQRVNDIHDEFHKVAPQILSDNGYKLTSKHSDRHVWTKVNPDTGHIHFAVLSKKKPNEVFSGSSAATALIGSSTGASTSTHRVLVPYLDDKHSETKGKIGPDFKNALNAHHEFSQRNMYESVDVNEEVEDLDEGRGRPPKEGSEAWKRRQELKDKGESEGSDERHIIDDLRKASTNIKGEGPVRFKSGVDNFQRSHAIRILANYMKQEKPADKEAMQDRISHSYEHLKKEL